MEYTFTTCAQLLADIAAEADPDRKAYLESLRTQHDCGDGGLGSGDPGGDDGSGNNGPPPPPPPGG